MSKATADLYIRNKQNNIYCGFDKLWKFCRVTSYVCTCPYVYDENNSLTYNSTLTYVCFVCSFHLHFTYDDIF